MRVAAAVLLVLVACGGAPDPLAELNKPCAVSASCPPELTCVDVGFGGGRRCVLIGPDQADHYNRGCPTFTEAIAPPESLAFCLPKCGPYGSPPVFIPCAYGIPCEPTLHICWL